MHFSNTLITFLLSTALTNFVTSSPIDSKAVVSRDEGLETSSPVESKLNRRFQNLDDDVDASDDTWKILESICGGSATKRSLEARAPPGGPWEEVAMGDSKSYNLPIGLWTQNLKSCIGMGITATEKKGGAQVRVLGHFTTDRMSKESQWEKFSGLVDKDNLENRKGFMSVPDRENDVPSIMNEDALKALEEIEDELTKRLDSLVDGDPAKTVRPMKPGSGADANTMSIAGANNEVKINGAVKQLN